MCVLVCPAPLPKLSTSRQQAYLDRAARVAEKSTMTHRHGCVIVNCDGVVISEGYNHHRIAMSHKYSIHAEISALYKAKRSRTKLSQCEMYIVRLGPSGDVLKYSMPCEQCASEITKAGIRRVYFSH